jgi:hypothetical protein
MCVRDCCPRIGPVTRARTGAAMASGAKKRSPHERSDMRVNSPRAPAPQIQFYASTS